MTVKLLLDGRVWLLPWQLIGPVFAEGIGSRMERSLDRRHEPIGPPITTGIRQLIEG